MKIFVYPGSFDPITNGHLDIIDRTEKLCNKLIVAVLANNNKRSFFSMEERKEMLELVLKDRPNVEVDCFSGLLVDFAAKKNATAIIKGLRAVSDFEYELQMALLNKNLSPDIETLFMMTSINYSFLSSSAVREIASHRGKIDDLVPASVREIIKKKFSV